jgi:hypothetical protein
MREEKYNIKMKCEERKEVNIYTSTAVAKPFNYKLDQKN